MSSTPLLANLFDSAILACPMCLSGASGKDLMAANSAILIMLGFLGLVLASFVAFIVYLAKRARHLGSGAAPESPLS